LLPFSCSKGDDTLDDSVTGSYVPENFIKVEVPIMYTKNSLITDSNTIKNFVYGMFVSGWPEFSFGKTSETTTQSVEIKFISKGEGAIKFGNQMNPFKGTEDEKNYVFNRKDTTTDYLHSTPSRYVEILDKITAYGPLYKKYSVTQGPFGRYNSCVETPVELIVTKAEPLYINNLSTFLIGKRNGGFSDATDRRTMVATDIQPFLNDTDTVVVQRKKWSLKKK
jgi:hypothetical protein